jgi:hypothetical protein
MIRPTSIRQENAMTPTTRLFTTLILLASTVLAACATSGERQRFGAEELAIYTRHAGEPVDQIRSFRLISWQPVSDFTLLLEARLNDWFLIEVDGPCSGLPWANKIGFNQTMNALQARFDSIVVEGLPCRIRSIRPVDKRAAQEEIRALRAGS